MKHTCLFLIVCFKCLSQNEPVSQAANSMVDLLTGDFHYELPVMTVPGPNGENVPIVFSYRSGIRMDQESSWIGLGWDYNPGEITRNVNGVADDWNGKTIHTYTYQNGSLVSSPLYKYFGPLYFANCNRSDTTNKMDINTSIYHLNEGEAFSFPDYDEFYASGPGISGKISARIYNWGGFYTGALPSPYIYSSTTSFPAASSKQTHFYFESDNNIVNVSQQEGKKDNSIGNFYSPSTNRIITGNCIEYFTNYEIGNNFSSLADNGFLDYRIPSPFETRRPTTDFDPDGIGAFQITTPSGLIYHYSLPVYTLPSDNSPVSYSKE